MNKIAALYKAAPFLRAAQGTAMTFWREPDYDRLDPTVILVRTRRLRTAATYWSHALSRQPSPGLARSFKGRTFLVVDRNSSCLLGLVAFTTPKDHDGDRDASISWPGDLRERLAQHHIEAARILVPQPFAACGGAQLVVDAMQSPAILGNLEARESATFCAISHSRTFNDDLLDDVQPIIRVPCDGRRLYIFEPHAHGLAYLRSGFSISKVGPLRSPALKLSRFPTEEWDSERYTLPRLLAAAEDA